MKIENNAQNPENFARIIQGFYQHDLNEYPETFAEKVEGFKPSGYTV